MANYYATITGQLRDPDGVAWKQAQWTAVPVSPSSKPVFPDGSPVPTTSGTLDDTGHFSGQVPQTLAIIPPGTTLTVTISPLTSSAPVTLTKVQTGNNTTLDFGALLSPRIPAPRIAGSAIVYAYDVREITNPKHGNGYVNTTTNRSYVYVQNSWQAIGTSIDPARVAYVDQPNTFTAPTEFEAEVSINPNARITGDPYSIDLFNSPGHSLFASVYKDTTQPGNVELMGEDSAGAQQVRYLKGEWNNGVPQVILGGDTIAPTLRATDGQIATEVDPGAIHISNNGIIVGQKVGSPFGTTAEIRTDNSLPATYIDGWGSLNINSNRSNETTHVYGNFITENLSFNHAIEMPINTDVLAARSFGLYHTAQNVTNGPPSLGTTWEVFWFSLGSVVLLWSFNHTPYQLYFTIQNTSGWAPWQVFSSTPAL